MKKRKISDYDVHWRRVLTAYHGDMDEAGMTRAMFNLFFVEFRLTKLEHLEKSGRPGRPPGEQFGGVKMRNAFCYARQVKHQMEAEGVSRWRINWKVAEKAAADLKADPYFADYEVEDLKEKLRTGLRNTR